MLQKVWISLKYVDLAQLNLLKLPSQEQYILLKNIYYAIAILCPF